MSKINTIVALVSGLALGAVGALLLAPNKGEETRQKIADLLHEHGVKLSKEDFEKLIDSIEARFRPKTEEEIADAEAVEEA